jgi:4-hydroxy-tetrahydrodipicolinate reductase
MGQRIIACAAADATPWRLVAAIERAGHPRAGTDAGLLSGIPPAGVAIGDAWDCPADVVIDFSLPEAVPAIVATCVAKRVPLVVATTGLEAADQTAIEAAATLTSIDDESVAVIVIEAPRTPPVPSPSI